jgi:ribose transport system permease protein
MTTTTTPETIAQEVGLLNSAGVWRWLGRYGTLMMLGLLIVVVAIMEPSTFATRTNFISILNQSSFSAIIAIGLTFALVTGEFDLSIGNAASLAGVVSCTLMVEKGISIPLAFLVAILVGAAIGLLNGLVVTKLNVNALVATLGVGSVAIGVNFAIANGQPISPPNVNGLLDISLNTLFGIPYPVYIMFGVAAASWFLLNRTVLGQSMQAVGGNPVAASLSGIRVERVKIVAFLVCSILAGLTGILLVTKTGAAGASAGDSYLLSAFAAAFFGSAVMRDGEFHIIGTVVGVVTVSVGFNAIALIGLDTYYQFLFQGLVLIVGVGVGSVARKRAAY